MLLIFLEFITGFVIFHRGDCHIKQVRKKRTRKSNYQFCTCKLGMEIDRRVGELYEPRTRKE